jgi:hypothetical protein
LIEATARKMCGRNDEALVYPKYRAPVGIVRDGQQSHGTPLVLGVAIP